MRAVITQLNSFGDALPLSHPSHPNNNVIWRTQFSKSKIQNLGEKVAAPPMVDRGGSPPDTKYPTCLDSTAYYRAMHFSANAQSWDRMSSVRLSVRPSVRPSVRLSVCPSVTLVICDHIGWKSCKLIARTISPTLSLFVAKRRST